MSYATYYLPSHCELAVVLEKCIMFVFSPMVTPFRYKVVTSDADDFWSKYCYSCSLRASICEKTGTLSNGGCALNNKVKTTTEIRTVQMPVPRHVLFFAIYEESVKFAYEKNDGTLVPMRLSNIWSDGRWCDGDVHYSERNPTSIYTGYFSSVHNKDLTQAQPYSKYIEDLAAGRTQIEDGDSTFNPENRWGAVRAVIQNPTKIEWSHGLEEGFLRIRGYEYAKIS